MSKKKQKYRSSNASANNVNINTNAKISANPKAKKNIGSESPWWLALIPAAAVFIFLAAAYTNYPYSEMLMEKINFFAYTPEFITAKLAEYPGVTNLATAWLLQFFYSSTQGIIIEALLFALVALLAALMPIAWGQKSNHAIAIIPPIGIALAFKHMPMLSLEAAFIFGALAFIGLATRRKAPWHTTVAIVIVGFLCFWTLAFPATMVLLVSASILLSLRAMKALKANASRGEKILLITNAILPLLFIIVTIVSVIISSNTLDFIPLYNRWWFMKSTNGDQIYFVIFTLAPILLMFIPRIGRSLVQAIITAAISIIVGFFAYHYITNDEGMQVSEEVYYFSELAENGQWSELLSEVNSQGEINNNIYLQYALLAEAGLGTLADNIFHYPINNPENICPRFDKTPQSTDFCRIYYRELGMYDEAFHHAFQYGMMASQFNGFCHASMRHMIDYSIKVGDKPLAEKYLWIMERTSCHDDFVAEQREKLNHITTKQDTIRAVNFVRANAFNGEIAYLLDMDRNNKRLLDYLLCGLLLNKQLETFKTVINEYSTVYNDVPLPRAYAEAAAMINHLHPGLLNEHITYDPKYNKDFEDFTRLHNSKQDDSAYQGTFWYYYVYAQIPENGGWKGANMGATS